MCERAGLIRITRVTIRLGKRRRHRSRVFYTGTISYIICVRCI